MKNLDIYAIVLLLTLQILGCNEEEKEKIKKVFDEYSLLNLPKDSTQAIRLISSHSKGYLNNVIEVSRNSNIEKIKSKPTLIKICAIPLLLMYQKDELNNLSIGNLFVKRNGESIIANIQPFKYGSIGVQSNSW